MRNLFDYEKNDPQEILCELQGEHPEFTWLEDDATVEENIDDFFHEFPEKIAEYQRIFGSPATGPGSPGYNG